MAHGCASCAYLSYSDYVVTVMSCAETLQSSLIGTPNDVQLSRGASSPVPRPALDSSTRLRFPLVQLRISLTCLELFFFYVPCLVNSIVAS